MSLLQEAVLSESSFGCVAITFKPIQNHASSARLADSLNPGVDNGGYLVEEVEEEEQGGRGETKESERSSFRHLWLNDDGVATPPVEMEDGDEGARRGDDSTFTVIFSTRNTHIKVQLFSLLTLLLQPHS